MVSTINPSSAFSRRSALTWLLALNGLMFLVLRVIAAAGVVTGHDGWGDAAVSAVSLPHSVGGILAKPWTAVTYMFTQYEPLHLMFNMLWLAWFGILVQLTLGNRRMIAFYGAGGLAGAAAYLICCAFTASFAPSAGLAGSSAAVISVATAIAVIEPDRRIGLIFFGSVRLKWVTAIMIFISVLLFSGYNAGTDAAHLGGALAGVGCGLMVRLRRRRRVYVPRPFVPATKPCAEAVAMSDTETLDMLLDKIRRSGFNSLDSDERQTLFNLSQRLKNTDS